MVNLSRSNCHTVSFELHIIHVHSKYKSKWFGYYLSIHCKKNKICYKLNSSHWNLSQCSQFSSHTTIVIITSKILTMSSAKCHQNSNHTNKKEKTSSCSHLLDVDHMSVCNAYNQRTVTVTGALLNINSSIMLL